MKRMATATEQERMEDFRATLRSARRTIALEETIRLAVDSFRANKARFALTALGMVIGSASVILVVTIGLTGREYALGLISKIGTNMVELEYAGGGAVGTEGVHSEADCLLQRNGPPRTAQRCAEVLHPFLFRSRRHAFSLTRRGR